MVHFAITGKIKMVFVTRKNIKILKKNGQKLPQKGYKIKNTQKLAQNCQTWPLENP